MCYSLTGKDFYYFEVGISILFNSKRGFAWKKTPAAVVGRQLTGFVYHVLVELWLNLSGSELAQDEFLGMRDQQQTNSCSLLHRKECEL